ncbi:MAG: arsenate reductase ArsC [Candidatus Acidiferrales bacterium]
MKPKVLFLCTGNSARSQMAEGWLRRLAGDRFEALSAGVEPKGLNPLAVEAMRELGIDISAQRSKDVREFLGAGVQYVVSVCSNAKERCPVFPATVKSLHWDVDDPAAAIGTHDEKLVAIRCVRDELGRLIEREFLTKTDA